MVKPLFNKAAEKAKKPAGAPETNGKVSLI